MRFRLLLAFLLSIVAGLQSVKAQQAYACYTSENTTLTFYYDNLRSSRSGTTYDLNTDNLPAWYTDETNASVTYAVFDVLFANARPTSTYAWFYRMNNLQSITGIGYLNTSEVTTMEAMFLGCNKLTSLDLSTFNTANVTNMKRMFLGCNKLWRLDMSNFNTAKVTNMEDMFWGCRALRSLDLRHFNTAQVTNMSSMFYDCQVLADLDLNVSNFNTAQVTYMSGMFYNCQSLKRLNVSNFNTAQVTNMSGMFYNCQSLTSLDVSNFNTAKVTDMSDMFYNCQSLTSLDLSDFNTAKVTDMGSMFCDCQSLMSLDVSNFNTENVTDMKNMFMQCMSLESIDLSNFNTAQVTDMSGMFANCYQLASLDLSKFNTANVTNMGGMFSGCSTIKTILVGDGWSTVAVTTSSNMFKSCRKLVGGAGTTFDENHIDAAYAHIDGGPSNPGYFTGKRIYDLWIAGIQVTSDNINDLTELVAELDNEAMERFLEGEMEITFDEGSNTLTLQNAIINPETGNYGIQSKLQNLDIKLIGKNTITATNSLGVYLRKHDGEGATTFLGNGTLNITSNSGAVRTFRNVVIKDGANITAESTGDAPGFQGRPSINGGDCPTLTLQGKGTMLKAKGGSVGSLMTFKELNLSDGLAILEPVGATFESNVGVVINGRYVTNQWVVIAKPEPEAYACYTSSNTTLTFYYDNLRNSRTGKVYDLNTDNLPAWYTDETNASVTYAVFDVLFANARPTSTFAWFTGMENLQSIEGMEYLNTSEVTNMSYMFSSCESLTNLVVSRFNTEKVTNMGNMFSGCKGLTSLDLRNFNTANVESMTYMFSGCESLTSLDVSSFNTSKVTDMSFMFRCKALTSLDVSSFNTANVTTMKNMFENCRAMTSLDLSNFNTENVTNMHAMFWSCINLRSVDLSSFNTSNVYDMSMMFNQCLVLTSLNLSNFNTANVTTMSRMFESSEGLTKLDLSSFNTAQVTDMGSMFGFCQHLQTICVGDDWSTAAVTNSDYMFTKCTNLVGGAGTTYDENHIDASYAHIDGGPSNPGYLSQKRGDVNLDGAVDIADAVSVLNAMAGQPVAGDANVNGDYDANGNPVIDIADLVTVLNIMAGQ